jgi:hypothetical protein
MNIPDLLYNIRHLDVCTYNYYEFKHNDLIQFIRQHVASPKPTSVSIHVKLGTKGLEFIIFLSLKNDKTWNLWYAFEKHCSLKKFINTSISKMSLWCKEETAVSAWKCLADRMNLVLRVKVGTKKSKLLPTCPKCGLKRRHRCKKCGIDIVHERKLEPTFFVTLEKKVLKPRWIVRLLRPLGLPKDVVREVVYPFYTDMYGFACNK